MNSGCSSRRVVITGLGAITPIGHTVDEFWSNAVAGVSGAGNITRFDPAEYATKIAAEVKHFDPEKHMDRKEAKRLSRFLQFAVVAADAALADSKLNLENQDRTKIGVLIGSGIGGLDILTEQLRRLFAGGPSKVSPFLVPFMIPDMASGYVSIRHGLRGPNSCVVTACSTGANAVGDAAHIILRGEADVMLAGGCEAPITEIGVSGFASARAVTTRNDDALHASRPFDLDRDGFLIAEGAGVLVLEDLEHAKQRGATIYAEIVGYGMSADAFHITQPDPDAVGATASMAAALNSANLRPDQIEYVNAHGTSTPYNDRLETKAIRKLFGAHADKLAVSSTKSMIGHTLGAAGAIEAIACVKAIETSIVPPTINYETPDPDCDLDYVPNAARRMPVNYVVKNSFGFGGHNVSLVFGKFNG